MYDVVYAAHTGAHKLFPQVFIHLLQLQHITLYTGQHLALCDPELMIQWLCNERLTHIYGPRQAAHLLLLINAGGAMSSFINARGAL